MYHANSSEQDTVLKSFHYAFVSFFVRKNKSKTFLKLKKTFFKVIKTFFLIFFFQKKKRKHIEMILKQYLAQKSLNGTIEAKKIS